MVGARVQVEQASGVARTLARSEQNRGGAAVLYPLRGCEGAVSNEKLLELILELNA